MSDAGLPSWLASSSFVSAEPSTDWDLVSLDPGLSGPLDALVERIGQLMPTLDPWAEVEEAAPGLTPEQRRALGG